MLAAATSGGRCLRDAAGFSQVNICTANDVRIARFDVLGSCDGGSRNGSKCVVGAPTDPCVTGGGTCVGVTACQSGQPVAVPVRATILSGATTRYDIGIYIAQDGGDAKGNPLTVPHGGACFRDFLHPASTTNTNLQLTDGDGPYFNGEINVVPTDTCADIRSSDGNNLYDVASITMICRDTNGDGILDVGTCLSWDINNGKTCNSELDTVPSSTSKCRCESIAIGHVTVCGNGTVERAAGEQCDEGAANGTSSSCCTSTCTLKPAGTVCRPSAGVCDPQEVCNGSAATCPADGKSTAVCRPSAGVCDIAESCNGIANDCPTDTFQPNSVECRASGGVCDPAEHCTGSSAACPTDAKSTALCRPSAGVCDVAESCDGVTNDCPRDAFQPTSVECRASAGVCDSAEHCTGSAAACPADAKSTAVCRSSAGVCDVAENCDGVSNGCPPDAFQPSSVECRASAGVCDPAEHCTGSAAACPSDAKSTAVCRSSAGVCDVAENCDGVSNGCPPDAFQPSSVECRASAGVCDPGENCTGGSAACPGDVKSTAVCRPSAGVCDVAENCDGLTNDCPRDSFQPASVECRASAGVCDPAEHCTGSTAACPADAKSTEECRASAGVCDVAETCDGDTNDCPPDSFQPSSVECRGSAGVCDPAEHCTGSSAACPADAKSTEECRASAGVCDVAENCDGVSNDCPPDAFQPSSVECRGSAGACDPAENCTGSSATCPADAKSTAVCRPATGECDRAERCDGTANTCPADAFASDGASCPDTDGMACTTPGCEHGQCNQEHGNTCSCELSVVKTGCVAPSSPPQCNTTIQRTPPPPHCLGKIGVLRLQYTGGGCGAMNNSQATDKVKCTQLGSGSSSPVRVRVTDGGSGVWLDTATATIELGEVFEVAAASIAGKTTLAADTLVKLFDANNTLREQIKFKTDCSQPVNLGDVFGGLEVVGMQTTRGGTVSLGGSEVNYTYEITNIGTVTASNVTVDDDRLGTVPGSPIASLAPGHSVTLTARQSVDGTVVNTVTVSAGGQCSGARATAAILAPCVLGYPFASEEPRTNVVFNESDVLRAFQPDVARRGERLKVFYNDEHALTLGVRRVLVKTAAGTSMTDYGVSSATTSPGGVLHPMVGTTVLDGDQAGTDTSACAGFADRCDRPMFPALFITDITEDPDSRAGDWQYGGTPIAPHAVYGTWKAAVKTVDKTHNPPVVTVTPDADPAKNDWALAGGDPAPAGLANEGYGAEVVWNVDDLGLEEGHVYRVQFVVHDGDQNKSGGDAGEGCATVFVR